VKYVLDEFELSFPVNVWNKMLYDDLEEIKIDIFYNESGHPKQIHDAFGASAINDFRLAIINEILSRNFENEIWKISSDSFAIVHKCSNCDSFTIYFRGIKQTILKKTVLLKTCHKSC
jgi:hypothetical protein